MTITLSPQQAAFRRAALRRRLVRLLTADALTPDQSDELAELISTWKQRKSA